MTYRLAIDSARASLISVLKLTAFSPANPCPGPVALLWSQFHECWSKNRPLTMLIIFALVCLLVSLAGLAFDQRFINGERAWIKPTKFSISLAVYGFTLIYFSQYLTKHRYFFKRIAQAAMVGTIVELSAIIFQVIRGTTSHFNTSGPFNHAIFWITTSAIVPVAFGIIALFVMLQTEENLPPVLGLALRWALFLTIIGLLPGVLMILPDRVQDVLLHHKQFDGHTIGYPEGGPGLPWLGWSTVAGDLRVAHFVGIHALQILPIIGYAISKSSPKVSIARQQLLVKNVGITYLSCVCLLIWQALSAESLVTPSHNTLACGLVALIGSLAAVVLTLFLPEIKSSKTELVH